MIEWLHLCRRSLSHLTPSSGHAGEGGCPHRASAAECPLKKICCNIRNPGHLESDGVEAMTDHLGVSKPDRPVQFPGSAVISYKLFEFFIIEFAAAIDCA